MTNAEFRALLDACDWSSPQAVSKLITSTHTDVKFNDKVTERQLKSPLGAYNYFRGLFGNEVWADGQGNDLVREYATDPHIPFSFARFVAQSEICDPNLADECRNDRCVLPEGGRGTLPGQRWFKWGFKTQPDCIANIRHIRDFQYWARRATNARFVVDEQVMNMFYTMAGIYTAGHKIVMQGRRVNGGLLELVPNNNPRNPLQGGLYNFMQEKFPQPTSLEDIMPLTIDNMRPIARYLDRDESPMIVARGPRGEAIFETWFGDDFFEQEFLRNPDYLEKIKLMMPNSMFPGFTLQPGDREIVQNWATKVMKFLPRFGNTADGKIVPVDNKVGVDIEVGQEFLNSMEFENAPFGIMVMTSGQQGTILTRPTLSQSGQGIPIEPIMSNGPWRMRNEYDKECNPDRNMPWMEKDYHLGFRMDNPNAGLNILYRRRVFRTAPISDCDLAALFTSFEEPEVGCAITTVGCNPNKRPEDNSIVSSNLYKEVRCTFNSCGNTNVSPFLYRIKIDRTANEVDFNSLGCECGSAVKLYIYGDEGQPIREQLGIVKEASEKFPRAIYFIETTTALATGECIGGIACSDETPRQANVIDAWGIPGSDNYAFQLDGTILCDAVGDDVLVRYYDENGVVLGTVAAEIVSFDMERFVYVLSSTDPTFSDEKYANQSYIGVSCNQAPFASSSSSGDA